MKDLVNQTKRVYDKIAERVKNRRNTLKLTRGSRFDDVTNNILTTMISAPSSIEYEPKDTPNIMKAYMTGLKFIRTYLRLLDNNAEFRKAESKNGYVPIEVIEKRMAESGDCYTHEMYVGLAKEMLEGEEK